MSFLTTLFAPTARPRGCTVARGCALRAGRSGAASKGMCILAPSLRGRARPDRMHRPRPALSRDPRAPSISRTRRRSRALEPGGVAGRAIRADAPSAVAFRAVYPVLVVEVVAELH